jgi:hypothetical protein
MVILIDPIIKINLYSPVILTQLVGIMHYYVRDRGSNPDHPTYPVVFQAARLPDKK